MSKTLLNAINEVFKRVNNIAGDAAALTSLVDSARQHPIDVAVQVINEGIDELYSYTDDGLPLQQAESTITLLTGTREYTLATDLIRLHFPLVDRTNAQYLSVFPGGYDEMITWDPYQTQIGLPQYAAISPINNKLRTEIIPDASSNGRIYTYEYEKNLAMTLATDTVPFSDAVFRSMVPAWVQLYKRETKNEFDQVLYQASMGRASRYLSELEPRTSYLPRESPYTVGFDPYNK